MAKSIEVVAFGEEHLTAAAQLWVSNYQKQRQAVPVLPEIMLDAGLVAEKIAGLAGAARTWAALEGQRLVGYLGGYLVDEFRNTSARGSYVPVWGHAAQFGVAEVVYHALYRPAAAHWFESGCSVHALTLLADDSAARDAWFWNGFGMGVVDAIRSTEPIGVQASEGVVVRQAQVQDAELIAELEEEHFRHYSQPPVLMVPSSPDTAQDYREFLGKPENSVWLAFAEGAPVGYLRFESGTFGATDIVESPTTIVESGAFMRPQARGLRAAPAMLDAALRHYAALGYQRCSVDFEAFNPEAVRFWMKYFKPVCLSLIRHPEVEPPGRTG